MRKLKVLDCTLRDGGFALEDAVKNNIETELFGETERKDIANHIMESNVDIIELGAIEVSDNDKKGFAIYQDMEEISSIISNKLKEHQLTAAFYRGPDIEINTIPDWDEKKIDITRVCLRYSELDKSLKFSAGLSKKGYKVFLQPMVTVRYTMEELEKVLNAANEMGAYAVYFVDSYGYMTPDDIIYYFSLFDRILNPEICIGFHAHNNMELALINVMKLMSIETERSIIIDSCATGMGQGTGNIQSEIVMNYLNEVMKHNYKLEEIYKACEIVDRYNVDKLWGYSIPRFIAAKNKTAYKYAMDLKNEHKKSYSEIEEILSRMPDDLRYRYTPQNTRELLKRLGKQ